MADADSNCAVAIEYVQRQYVLYTLNHIVSANQERLAHP
jgi:hypothetical protein